MMLLHFSYKRNKVLNINYYSESLGLSELQFQLLMGAPSTPATPPAANLGPSTLGTPEDPGTPNPRCHQALHPGLSGLP